MIRRAPILVGLALLLLPSSGYAGFPTPPTGAEAWLYETAERVTFDVKRGVTFREAVSPLMGFALVGTPLCPSAMLANVPGLAHCTVSGVGKSTLDARTGHGPTTGTFDVVVDIPSSPSVHIPNFPVISGTFRGDIRALPGLPLLSLTGRFRIRTVDAKNFPELESWVGASVSFAGTFRIPVGPNETSGLCPSACFVVDDSLVPLQDAEVRSASRWFVLRSSLARSSRNGTMTTEIAGGTMIESCSGAERPEPPSS